MEMTLVPLGTPLHIFPCPMPLTLPTLPYCRRPPARSLLPPPPTRPASGRPQGRAPSRPPARRGTIACTAGRRRCARLCGAGSCSGGPLLAARWQASSGARTKRTRSRGSLTPPPAHPCPHFIAAPAVLPPPLCARPAILAAAAGPPSLFSLLARGPRPRPRPAARLGGQADGAVRRTTGAGGQRARARACAPASMARQGRGRGN